MKRKIFGIFMVYTIVFASMWACEEEDGLSVNDPTVSIFFLNKDSLDQVNVIVDSLDDELVGYDTVIINLKTSADKLVDSLVVLSDSIANGGGLKEDSVTVRHDLDTLNLYLTGIETEDSTVNVRRTEWSDIATVINSGSVKVLEIENMKNGQSVFYEDSSTNWKLPLDMNADDIEVNITIDTEVYKLGLTYSRSTTTDEKNRVIIRTSNFKIEDSGFKNASVSCADCADTETTIHVEF